MSDSPMSAPPRPDAGGHRLDDEEVPVEVRQELSSQFIQRNEVLRPYAGELLVEPPPRLPLVTWSLLPSPTVTSEYATVLHAVGGTPRLVYGPVRVTARFNRETSADALVQQALSEGPEIVLPAGPIHASVALPEVVLVGRYPSGQGLRLSGWLAQGRQGLELTLASIVTLIDPANVDDVFAEGSCCWIDIAGFELA